MGFFGFGKNEKLLAWQNVLLGEEFPKLKMNEKQLLNATMPRIESDLRIINDCRKVLAETIDPDVFFPRLRLMEVKVNDLVLFEPYVGFKGAKPSAALQEFYQDKDACIYNFAVRYYDAVEEKARNLKTEKAKIKRYKEYYENMEVHFNVMNEECKNYVESKKSVYSYIDKI